jgi:hypothetical protein
MAGAAIAPETLSATLRPQRNGTLTSPTPRRSGASSIATSHEWPLSQSLVQQSKEKVEEEKNNKDEAKGRENNK